MSGVQAVKRPVITYTEERFRHDGIPMRVVLRRDLISIGCSDVTPAALRKLLAEYDKHFPSGDYVLQP